MVLLLILLRRFEVSEIPFVVAQLNVDINALDMSSRKKAANKEESSPAGVQTKPGGGEASINDASTNNASLMDNIAKVLAQAGPIITMGQRAFAVILPYLSIAYDKYKEISTFLAPYRVDLLLPAFVGFILCFFGGTFFSLIAAAEAYRQMGYKQSIDALHDLQEDFVLFIEENKKDDGDVNVKAEEKRNPSHKFFVFLKSIHPDRFTAAVEALYGGFLAVIATLRLQFAKAITLGSSLGNIAEKPLNTHIVPLLEEKMPAGYSKWAKCIVHYSVKLSAIWLAFFLQKILYSVHAAVRGGIMISRNLLEYVSVMKWLPKSINHEDTLMDEIVGGIIAFIGFSYQVRNDFVLPFPLNVLLFPFTCLEMFIEVFMS